MFGIAPPAEFKALSYVPADLIQPGSAVIAGYPQPRTSIDAGSCTFSPDWDPSTPGPALLSYACYSFMLDGYDHAQEITFTFESAGDNADAWVALSDFTRNCWEWHPLPAGNVLAADLAGCADPVTGRLIVIPLFTGTDVWKLTRVKVGNLAAVDGYVYEEDGTTPLAGVDVVLTADEEFSATTDLNGYWIVEGVVPGDYTVAPVLIGWTFIPETRQVTVAGEDQSVDGFLALPATGPWVSGSLEDETGFGLGGCEILITHQYSSHGGISIVSSKSGRWQVSLPDGDYTATPKRYSWDFAPESRDFTVSGDPLTVPVFIGTEGDGATVDGYVYHGDTLEPFVAVQVSLYHDTLDLMYTAWTDATGYWFVEDLYEGGYSAEVIETGYGFTPSVQLFSISGPDVRLDPFYGNQLEQYDIQGYIFEPDEVTPLANISVRLGGASGWRNTVTDSQGRYSFRDVWAGQYSVIPSEAGYTFTPRSHNVTLTGDVTLDPFLGAKKPAYTVDGYVYETESTTPVPGVTVKLSYPFSYDPLYSAVTDSEGHYVIAEVLDGSYTATPSRQGLLFAPRDQQIEVAGSDLTVPDFTSDVPPCFTLDGYVYETDGSTPVPGVTVGVTGVLSKYTFEGVTDPAGHWEVFYVVAGTYHVTPSLAPWSFTPTSREVVVTDSDLSVPSFLGTELEAYTVDGYVYHEGSTTPVPDVRIEFSNPPHAYSRTTDAEGYYSIPLPPGNWEARPVASCWDFDPVFHNFVVGTTPQTLPVFYASPGG